MQILRGIIVVAGFMLLSSVNVPFDKIKQAFEQNNPEYVIGLSKDKVLLNVMGNESVYSRSQAILVLKKHFEKHPCQSFTYLFKSEKSGGEGIFAIGTMKTATSSFRITMHFIKRGEENTMESLAIEQG